MPKRRLPVIHPFDQLHGTDTSGLLPGPAIAAGTPFAAEELTAYYGVAPSILQGVLDLWLRLGTFPAPMERTVFFDVGAGKGRAVLLAAQYPFLRVEGVELNPALFAVARSNLARWKTDPFAQTLAPIQLHEADATRHPLPPEPTLVYLFHPFEAALLRRFVRHILGSVRARPRPLDLAYINAEHHPLLDRTAGLERLWLGRVPMSPEDHLADIAAIETQKEYGSTGDEVCALYRTIVK